MAALPAVRDRTGQFRDSRSLRSALTNKRKLVERGLTFITLGKYLNMQNYYPASKMRCVRSTIVGGCRHGEITLHFNRYVCQ